MSLSERYDRLADKADADRKRDKEQPRWREGPRFEDEPWMRDRDDDVAERWGLRSHGWEPEWERWSE